jgi:hypothetical protein
MPSSFFRLTLSGSPQRLSDVYGDGAGVVNAAHDVPLRQLVIQAAAATTISDASATAATGLPIGVAGTLVLGPFDTGPVKLSEFWVQGSGNLSLLGIPY